MSRVFFLFSFILTHSLSAQTNLRIIDSVSKKPLISPRIYIDSTLQTNLTKTSNGEIILLNSIGKQGRIESTMYSPYTFIVQDGLQEILMKPQSQTIREAVIQSVRPQIKLEAGKTTLDASNATIQQGTIRDLLQQIPGVIINNDGTIQVKGKSGLRILVDGRTAQLAQVDIKTFLESIQASSVKSIEIMTNPGAKYDAEGKSGIISIKTKKDNKAGFNTKLQGGIGSIFNKYSGGINSNYKTEKWNFSGNYQFLYKDQWFSYSENRVSMANNAKQYFDYIASWQNISRNHTGKIGIDHFFHPNTTLSYTLDISHFVQNGKNHYDNTSQQYDENHNLITSYNAFNIGDHITTTYTNALSFRNVIEDSKIEWTADGSYTRFIDIDNNTNTNYAFDSLRRPLTSQYYYFSPHLDNRVSNLMFKSDWMIPMSDFKVETGVKNESNFNKNNYIAYIQNYGGLPYTTPDYFNQFNYNENIFATYLSANPTVFKKYQLDVGLRIENTNIQSNNNAVSRQYLNIFPTAGISFAIDSQYNFSLKYSRRIDRPSFSQLNNKKVYYNRYTANIGVPTLQPEISDVLSCQIDRSFLDGTLNLSLGSDYNIEQNDISEINMLDSNFVNIFTYGNVGQAKIWNSYLNIYYRPSAKWDLNLTTSYTYSDYQSTINGIANESKGGGFSLSGQTSVMLPAKFNLRLNGFLNTNQVWAQGYSLFMGVLNASIVKNFYQDRLSLSLSCQDIFNSNRWRGIQNTGNINSTGIWKPETRIAWLNASYTFGNKINYKRKELEKSNRLVGGGR